MQGIEFERDEDLGELSMNNSHAYKANQTFLLGLLAKVGIEDKSTANIILVALAAILFGLAIIIFADSFSHFGALPSDSLRP